MQNRALKPINFIPIANANVTTPASGTIALFSEGGKLKQKNDAGVVLDYSEFVDKLTAQTVGGIKTFSSFGITPSAEPTTDYQWANKKYVDDNGGASPLTTKGDLFTYSTVDARLPVGTNGWHLVADSAETTGLKWEAVPSGSYNGINGQSIQIAGEIVDGEIGELTSFNTGSFNEMQISTLTRTTGTLTITVKKNGTSVGTATITSATSATNSRYFGVSTNLADAFVANDVITIEASDSGTGSNNLVINFK